MYKKTNLLLCITLLLGACTVATPESAQAPVPTPSPSPTPEPTQTYVPTPIPSPTPAPWDRAGWNIVWHDEFEGAELDRTNWTFDIGGNGWGNAEREAYTDKPENIRIEDGMLVIEAREDPTLPAGLPYSSARIKTLGLHSWTYGRIEARMKLPYGQGIWPAFWMVGDNNQKWPATGEVDIFEYIGGTPDSIYAGVHGPGYSGSNGIVTKFVISEDALKNDFHIYALEWKENELRWLFDEQEYFKVTPADVSGEWVFDHPFFIIMNVAVGGSWPGYPDETTIFPQFMNVDYVRVYQKP